MAAISLSEGIIRHFNITDHSEPKKGGQKTVFIVTIDGNQYALKIIDTVDERFEREVRICEKYSESDGIPNILRIERLDSETVILEEYIDGSDLCDIAGSYEGDEKKVCDLILKVGTILKPVWQDEFVHRDLKPQNIRIRENGKPVVLDFGIARALNEDSITATGGQPLSWLYASPEQYSGSKRLISYRTDFFCLGIIAYKLFTSTLPFGNDRGDIYESFQGSDLSISSSSATITDFCNAVFRKNPSERPRQIESFLKLLEL